MSPHTVTGDDTGCTLDSSSSNSHTMSHNRCIYKNSHDSSVVLVFMTFVYIINRVKVENYSNKHDI